MLDYLLNQMEAKGELAILSSRKIKKPWFFFDMEETRCLGLTGMLYSNDLYPHQ
jgi:hypothetical protein